MTVCSDRIHAVGPAIMLAATELDPLKRGHYKQLRLSLLPIQDRVNRVARYGVIRGACFPVEADC